MQFFCQAAAFAPESIFCQKILTIECGMAFAGLNDGAPDDAVTNDFTGAETLATNEWLYSHDDKCQILANRPPSH